MRGIISAGAYVPHWRMDRSKIAEFHGGRLKGERAVASYDEDTTTMAVEAARNAMAGASEPSIDALVFTSSTPTYLEKTNAAIAHAALRLPSSVPAYDQGGAVRSGVGAIRSSLRSNDTTLLCLSETRGGLPNSVDEHSGGDGAAALVIGDDSAGPVLAEYLGGASTTQEFLDRWRTPGSSQTKQWEERFSQTQFGKLAPPVFAEALDSAGVSLDDVVAVLASATSARVPAQVGKKAGFAELIADDLGANVGHLGAAHLGMQLVNRLETASAGDIVVLISMVDGVDVLVFRVTESIGAWHSARPVADQVATGDNSLPYAKFLAWRDQIQPEPPRRPGPVRMSASAAGRSADWKYGFVGSKDRSSGAIHMPPARVSYDGGAVDDMEDLPMADAAGTVVTFTVDRLAYSPSPPVIFAVVDFDGGGRLPVELCDTTPESIAVGDRVEMRFRRLNDADGIANYFWKARPTGRSSAKES